MQLTAELPDKLGFLFEPMRYKVVRGGRGGGKSQGFAIGLLIKAMEKQTRILCAREVQKSIKDSVHRLISDQIQALGLGAFFDVLDTEIRCKNGSLLLFTGLSTHTVESIKSIEGVDICWVEEAKNVSKKSWEILLPTIRKEGSEIWISYNPELETDETHQRFSVNPPDDCISIEMNYTDNPYFPLTLEKERLNCKRQYPKDYDNIWLGKCKPAVEGAIYYDEIAQVQSDGRVCNIPYDPKLKVHLVFDLGWNDALAVSFIQVNLSEIRIIDYEEQSFKRPDQWDKIIREKPYTNWGRVWLPHDGFSGQLNSGGKSFFDLMRTFGWDVVPKEAVTIVGSVEQGIRVTRMAFPRFYFAKGKTERLIECAKRYSRCINKNTLNAGEPLRNEWAHGADNLRYVALNADNMTNDDYSSYGELPPADNTFGLNWG